ncbi:polyprenyl synthetase family protein [Lentzea flava]|uniref:Dimethylallyltransferase n=1 Tax=Lentzea flava TaxID=103732 RepID=A0ABQ2UC25_9PSEU|nr:polyprenyl synthetase family protein [Lentzea flava]MCP2196783.1 geranylgeranyl diphosphate synthase, type I [Lentzea flava]GGU15547.1 dimethylallyltransferase [Lentzea flava]
MADHVARLLVGARTLIEPVHRASVDELGPALRRVAGYHIGWWDAEGRPSPPGGKALRPALTLACARAFADGPPSPDVLAAATAVELIHDFTLLHDDVMDGDETRRHRPSAWAVFGTTAAILAGDALVGLAMRRVPPSLTGVLADVLVDLCEGQSADVAAETPVDVEQCLTTAARKTGALLGAACRLGALAAGADPAAADHCRWFGVHLGIAFQLVDDVLGIWGDPARTGKPAHSDIRARRRTLPVVAALASDTPAGRKLARIYLDGGGADEIAELVAEAGGRSWAEAEADRRVRLAFACLDRADPHPAAALDLRGLARLVTSRDR